MSFTRRTSTPEQIADKTRNLLLACASVLVVSPPPRCGCLFSHSYNCAYTKWEKARAYLSQELKKNGYSG